MLKIVIPTHVYVHIHNELMYQFIIEVRIHPIRSVQCILRMYWYIRAVLLIHDQLLFPW